MVVLTLPWPPSVNQYWRAFARGARVCTLLSAKGRAYREHAVAEIGATGNYYAGLTGRLAVLIDVYPPDRRKRDLDNLPKGILDAITHAGVWQDDEQIDDLRIVRHGVEKPGRVVVTITGL